MKRFLISKSFQIVKTILHSGSKRAYRMPKENHWTIFHKFLLAEFSFNVILLNYNKVFTQLKLSW